MHAWYVYYACVMYAYVTYICTYICKRNVHACVLCIYAWYVCINTMCMGYACMYDVYIYTCALMHTTHIPIPRIHTYRTYTVGMYVLYIYIHMRGMYVFIYNVCVICVHAWYVWWCVCVLCMLGIPMCAYLRGMYV